MIQDIERIADRTKVAIIVVGYNKLYGLRRLLEALNNACYDEESDVPLIISVDASGNEELYDFVRKFEWKHGRMACNIQQQRLGLKRHIFQCASLTKYFRGVMILEDDIFVSPYFYHYSKEVLGKYEDDSNVAGISLYNNETNGFVGLPLQREESGFDVYAAQSVSSWGEIWNERMWNDFEIWLEKWDGNFESIDMPFAIKSWSRAWSKYYYAYMISTNKYFIYPYSSLTTNFNDAGGEHGGGDISLVQVSLLQGRRNYQLGDFSELVCYDVYYQNVLIPSWLGLRGKDVVVDFYGMKAKYDKQYVLTPFKLPYKKIRSFSLAMRPWELNIKYNIQGDGLFLYERTGFGNTPPKRSFAYNFHAYFLRRYRAKSLLTYLLGYCKERLKNKLKK